MQLFRVLLEHETELRIQILREFLLQELADFLAMLAVAVRNGEEMAILEATKVGHRDPHVLVHFVGVAWREAGLRGERKFRDRVRVHLLRVAGIVRKRL